MSWGLIVGGSLLVSLVAMVISHRLDKHTIKVTKTIYGWDGVVVEGLKGEARWATVRSKSSPEEARKAAWASYVEKRARLDAIHAKEQELKKAKSGRSTYVFPAPDETEQ